MAPTSPGRPQPSPAAFPALPAVFGSGTAAPGTGAAAPTMMAGGGGGVPMGLAAMGSGGAPGMAAMGGGGWVMVAPPAAYLQSVQQWAGTAPGYMVYQHQAAPYGGTHSGSGSARASRLSNNSAGPMSPGQSGSLSPRGSGGSMARAGSGGLGSMGSGGLPHFPSRMESALGGVPTTSRQESLDRAAAAALEAAQAQHSALHGTRASSGRQRHSGGAIAAEARGGRELLQQLHAAAAAAEGGASAAAAAAREVAKDEQGNDAQGSATSAAAEEAAATAASRGGGGGSGGGSRTSGTASASFLSPARSGDLNNIDYVGGGNRQLGGSASNSSSQRELAGRGGPWRPFDRGAGLGVSEPHMRMALAPCPAAPLLPLLLCSLPQSTLGLPTNQLALQPPPAPAVQARPLAARRARQARRAQPTPSAQSMWATCQVGAVPSSKLTHTVVTSTTLLPPRSVCSGWLRFRRVPNPSRSPCASFKLHGCFNFMAALWDSEPLCILQTSWLHCGRAHNGWRGRTAHARSSAHWLALNPTRSFPIPQPRF